MEGKDEYWGFYAISTAGAKHSPFVTSNTWQGYACYGLFQPGSLRKLSNGHKLYEDFNLIMN